MLDPNEKNFSCILNAMHQRNFFVTGAGTSYPHSPLACELGNIVAKEHRRVGVYSGFEIPPGPLIVKLLRDIKIPLDGWCWEEILNRLTVGFSKIVILHNLAKGRINISVIPVSYKALNLFKRNSIIFDMNHDALAEKFCNNRHIVLPAHGYVPEIFGNEEYYSLLSRYYSLSFEASPNIPNMIFLEKESESLIGTDSYVRALQLFPQCANLVFIGYSFGFNEREMDDEVTLNFFKERLLCTKKIIPILVINPASRDLVEALKETYKKKNIYGINARWDILGSALVKMITVDVSKRREEYELCKLYYTYLDSQV